MNTFIKYLGKKIAAEQGFEIIDEERYFARVEYGLSTLIASRVYIEDAVDSGIIKKLDTEEREK